MPTPAEKAAAYLTKLEADRRAAIALSEEKAEEAKLIKARQEGFAEALEILGLQNSLGPIEVEPDQTSTQRRRNIPQLILRELSFCGQPMTKNQIAEAIDYMPQKTEIALKRLESSGTILKNNDGRWELANPTPTQHNGHDVNAN
jgi:hypothetical protein